MTQTRIDWLDATLFTDFHAQLKGSKRAAKSQPQSWILPEIEGSLQAIVAAQVARQFKTQVLLVTHDEGSARSLSRDLTALLGEAKVSLNPSLDHGGDSARAFEGWGRLGERVSLLQDWPASKAAHVIVSPIASLMERVPSRAFLADATLRVKLGDEISLETWARNLASRGHRRVPLVEAPGEFAIRGGILDVFPVGEETPIRVELFGDEVDSIRRFEATTQRSVKTLKSATMMAISVSDYIRARRAPDSASLLDYLPSRKQGGVLVLQDRCDLMSACEETWKRGSADDLMSIEELFEQFDQSFSCEFQRWPEDPENNPRVLKIGARKQNLDLKDLASLGLALKERLAKGEDLSILAPSQHDLDIFRAWHRDRAEDWPSLDQLHCEVLDLGQGFRLRSVGTVLSTAELLDQMRNAPVRQSVQRRVHAQQSGREVSSLKDLQVGQAVVHVVHGIGLFRGVKTLEHSGTPRDHLVIEYRDKAKLYIPVDRIGLIRHYIGPRDSAPKLSKLGSSAWTKKKEKVAKACADLAADLLEIQASRKVQNGTAYPPDGEEMLSFEAQFPFEETVDQQKAIDCVKDDLELPIPMDRIVCGDVGFGKTEVALRAAFKVAVSGRQVAILAPTTVLAQQHFRTFHKRLKNSAVIVDVLSRFRTRAQQKETIARLKTGGVDIVVGTHRLLSKDVKFKDLGLVVIDEEQRFGVAHKETLKAMRRTVDVLTMTATPIPRTLHMALSGARDISVIASPPLGRIPVKSLVMRTNEGVIQRALELELARGGQVYFVHDRVSTIDRMAAMVQRLVPKAKVATIHGQMNEQIIEREMMAFINGKRDVLVATKIIENGLDVPRANTLIVNRADRFGLAELHQIRGRVGRHRLQAFAYFLLPAKGRITDVAEKRLRAIEEYSDLGAGFRIALRDLELRGAGNLLGAQQSGHIGDVGYDLYCRLLRQAVEDLRKRRKQGLGERPMEHIGVTKEAERKAKLQAPGLMSPRQRGEHVAKSVDLELDTGAVEIDLQVPSSIPESYMPDIGLKIEVYRKLASAESMADLEDLADELRDRYGRMPDSVRSMFALRAVRLVAVKAGVSRMRRDNKVVAVHYRDRQLLQAALSFHKSRVRWVEDGLAHVLPDDPGSTDQAMLDEIMAWFSAVDQAGLRRGRRLFGMVTESSKKRRPKKRSKRG